MKNKKLHITLPNSTPSEEHYRFGADGNLRLYSYDRLFFSLYGYDGGTTRTYKYSFDLNPQWVNGRLEAVNFNLHTAMFYPNSYLNFNNDGYYTKHYYNGIERIASRLGDQNLPIHTHDPELQDRKDWQDSLIRKNIVEITGYEFLEPGQEQDPDDPKPVFELPVIGLNNLQPSADGIYYYHPNHLGSTCYVTDENATVQQGFLYAPFGEITNEHNAGWQSGVLPKYSFNAKELDEETGMYYYEARYYNPPTFISRDPLFEKYPTFSPYTYCANNPVKYVDPDGREVWPTSDEAYQMILASLPQDARDYVKRDAKGFIDRELINTYDCRSSNFNDLKTLVNLDCIIEVSVSSSYNYIENGSGSIKENTDFSTYKIFTDPDYVDAESTTINSVSTGETGNMGVVQLPESSASWPSTDDNVKVHINSQLSPRARAEVFAHEFFGHAFIYATTGDVHASGHWYVNVNGKNIDTNEQLRKRIITAKREVIYNNR